MLAQLQGTGSRWRSALAVAVASVTLCGVLTAASAAADPTLYASPTGAGACSTPASACSLPAAVAAAAGQSGAAVTIDLAAGTYAGQTSISSGSEQSLTLDGAGAGQTILSGSGGQTAVVGSGASFPTTFANLTLTNGTASGAGGGDLEIDNTAGVTLDDDAVTQAQGGGGITLVTGTAEIESTQISNNTGAGINTDASTTLQLLDSTVAANTSVGLVTDGTSRVYGTTLAYNSGGGIDVAGGTTDIGASVLADNSGGGDCSSGAPVNEGYDYTDDTTCTSLSASPSHIDDASLHVGTLAASGGPTETTPLTSSSAGYDVVPASASLTGDPNTAPFCSGTDQRGMARTEGPATACSAGAYQYAPPVITGLSPRATLDLGLPVTISGYGYGDVTSAKFGGVAATITGQTGDSLALDVPLSLALGSQPLTLTNPDGSASVAIDAVADPTPALVLAPGQLKVAYSQVIPVSGGVAPFTFAQSAGALPAGLTLSSTGVISGTPTKAGGTAFAVAVTDADGFAAASVNLSLDVATPIITAKRASVKLSRTTAPVRIACAGAPCVGTVSLSGSSQQKIHGHLVPVALVLGSANYKLGAGQAATIDVALDAQGRHTLAHVKKHPLEVALKVTVGGGTAATKTVRIS